MPTSTPVSEEVEDRPLETLVYGLNRKESVRRLISALAAVPCIPKVIFRIDRLGRLLGVVDHRPKRGTYYIQVSSWGSPQGDLPLICWTRDPVKIRRNLRWQADQRLNAYMSAVRKPPMKVEFTLRETLLKMQE